MTHSEIMERFVSIRKAAKESGLNLTTNSGSTFTVDRDGVNLFQSHSIMMANAFICGYTAKSLE